MTFLNYFLDITITGNLKNHLLLNYYHIDMDVENEKVAASGSRHKSPGWFEVQVCWDAPDL